MHLEEAHRVSFCKAPAGRSGSAWGDGLGKSHAHPLEGLDAYIQNQHGSADRGDRCALCGNVSRNGSHIDGCGIGGSSADQRANGDERAVKGFGMSVFLS